MNDLKEILKNLKIDETIEKIGLDFDKVFPLSDINPYSNHTWIVKQNNDFLIVNAIPKETDVNKNFWEEWYLNKGEIHHHILTLWEPPYYDEVFSAPKNDDIHPSISFGRKWYVCEDSDMRAMLLRRD